MTTNYSYQFQDDPIENIWCVVKFTHVNFIILKQCCFNQWYCWFKGPLQNPFDELKVQVPNYKRKRKTRNSNVIVSENRITFNQSSIVSLLHWLNQVMFHERTRKHIFVHKVSKEGSLSFYPNKHRKKKGYSSYISYFIFRFWIKLYNN